MTRPTLHREPIWTLFKAIPSGVLHDHDNIIKCMEDTCKDVLLDIESWIQDVQSTSRMLWLTGPIKVGKTCIAASVARKFYKCGHLIGDYFLVGIVPGKSDTLMAAAIAIAYRLSFLSKQAYDIISRTIQDDPSILQAHIRDQWERLVLNTLRKVEDRPSFRPLLVLDGLDECKSKDDQLWIINQLAGLCQEFPIAVMIASRPEWHLKEEFLRLQTQFPSLFRSTIDLSDREGALSDMRTILYKRYPYFRRTMEKAPESKRLEIEEGIIRYFSKVGGQYIVSECISENTGLIFPEALNGQAIDEILMDDRIESGIYMTLDDTGYTGFMANVYSNLTEEQITMSRRLLFHLLHIQPASIESLSAIWRYSPEEIHIALRPFHSVLRIPLSDRHPVTFYLFTFQKYLSSRYRGGEKRQFRILWSHFCIDALEYSLDFAGRCWKHPVIPAGSATLWLMIAPRINVTSRDTGDATPRKRLLTALKRFDFSSWVRQWYLIQDEDLSDAYANFRKWQQQLSNAHVKAKFKKNALSRNHEQGQLVQFIRGLFSSRGSTPN